MRYSLTQFHPSVLEAKRLAYILYVLVQPFYPFQGHPADLQYFFIHLKCGPVPSCPDHRILRPGTVCFWWFEKPRKLLRVGAFLFIWGRVYAKIKDKRKSCLWQSTSQRAIVARWHLTATAQRESRPYLHTMFEIQNSLVRNRIFLKQPVFSRNR